MEIPFFRYPHFFTTQEEAFIEATRDVGRRGAFIMQKDLADFEQAIADFSGTKYAIGVANATDGLQMGFMAGGVKQGDEVLFCSHTMVATASAIHYAGGVPIPVEAGPDHLMDPDKIEESITDKTRAICPTQLNGRTADMDKIQAIADKYRLQIYEDAAQALGSKWKGKGAGSFGVASCISFYPAKILGCLGDGGAVLTNDDEVYRKLMLLRDHGRDHDGDVILWGLNSRLDNLHAAYLAFQFKDYQAVIDRRRDMAAHFQANLQDVRQLVLPPSPDSDPNHFDVFQNYEIEAEHRDALREFLNDKGIDTLVQWGGKAVHQFRKLGFTQSLPYTEKLFERMVMLPFNMSVTDEEIDYICDTIESFYK
ncbi:DegT/DnrJ/EryC1/StrS family aminotransferase [Verrucomicrobia bacterium]|nr:DegT/DnrJ/EryC1/StrS family aminotransferase [Verrucomicrobiota bacterium]